MQIMERLRGFFGEPDPVAERLSAERLSDAIDRSVASRQVEFSLRAELRQAEATIDRLRDLLVRSMRAQGHSDWVIRETVQLPMRDVRLDAAEPIKVACQQCGRLQERVQRLRAALFHALASEFGSDTEIFEAIHAAEHADGPVDAIDVALGVRPGQEGA